MKHLYKLILLVLCTVTISCGNSDDSDPGPDQFLTEFVAPHINFGASIDAVIAAQGEPSSRDDSTEWAQITYNKPVDGIKNIRYQFLPNTEFEFDLGLVSSEVAFYQHEENYDVVLNWLVANYGEPEDSDSFFQNGETGLRNRWLFDNTFIILLRPEGSMSVDQTIKFELQFSYTI